MHRNHLILLCFSGLLAACKSSSVDTDIGIGGDNSPGGGYSSGAGGTGGDSQPEGGSASQGGAGGTSQGGAAGAPACIEAGNAPGGTTDSLCDNLNVTPTTAGGPQSLCDLNEDGDFAESPPGYDLCKWGFATYDIGAALHLEECIAKIGIQPAEACDLDLAFSCVATATADLCASEWANDGCDAVKTVCDGKSSGGEFDVAQCLTDLNPFGEGGFTAYQDCMNERLQKGDDCQPSHNACVDAIYQFQPTTG